MVAEEDRAKLRAAFTAGRLRIRSVTPGGDVAWKRVLQVFRHEVPEERIVALETDLGVETFTGGHRIYVNPTDRVPAEELRPGDLVLAVHADQALYLPVKAARALPPRRYMYDLTAEDHHNFVSGVGASSGTVKSNSPDKFYHFRPPEHEANIGAYNRVFGQLWENAELVEYLERALDTWNMMPPSTEGLNSLDALVRDKPVWRTAILWEAIVHACYALQANWTAEEFSLEYSENVKVTLPDGRQVDVPIGELYGICHDPA